MTSREQDNALATLAELVDLERTYRRMFGDAERVREQRNAAIIAALEAGCTHAAISEATGLSRGRISQIKP